MAITVLYKELAQLCTDSTVVTQTDVDACKQQRQRLGIPVTDLMDKTLIGDYLIPYHLVCDVRDYASNSDVTPHTYTMRWSQSSRLDKWFLLGWLKGIPIFEGQIDAK